MSKKSYVFVSLVTFCLVFLFFAKPFWDKHSIEGELIITLNEINVDQSVLLKETGKYRIDPNVGALSIAIQHWRGALKVYTSEEDIPYEIREKLQQSHFPFVSNENYRLLFMYKNSRLRAGYVLENKKKPIKIELLDE